MAVVQVLPCVDNFLTRRLLNNVRLYWVGKCPDPGVSDILDLAAHPDGIDLIVTRKAANQNGNVILASFTVGEIGEEKSLPVLRRDAPAELPAHQRVHLGVLVDQPIDFDEKPGIAKRFDMLVKIGIRS